MPELTEGRYTGEFVVSEVRPYVRCGSRRLALRW
jgi:hypothetical protein